MKRPEQRALILLALVPLTLFSCSRPAEKLKPEPSATGQDAPVPDEIKNQLLSAADIREGAELYAKTIIIDAQSRLLIHSRGKSLCSVTGDCPYWIFQKTESGYAQETEGSALSVDIEAGKSPFPEVLARLAVFTPAGIDPPLSDSIFSFELRLYQFDGNHYRLTKCMYETTSVRAHVRHHLDKPIISEIACKQ
jgi:hypothetical protein